MAPRKKKCSDVSATQPALRVKSNRAKITKSARTETPATRKSTRLAQKNWDCPVLHLEDGLVDLGHTPEHLVAAVEHNAASSPLLRLPGELRNKIYALAIGSHYVHIKEVVHSKTVTSYFMRTVGHAQVSLQDKTRQPTMFHLPEVCRQIYSETATLAYQLNTYIIGLDIGGNGELMFGLLPAQRNAITAASPESTFFEVYVSVSYTKSFRKSFPNLKLIEVPTDALDLIIAFNRFDDTARSWEYEDWQQWVVKKVKMKEGEDVEVKFEQGSEFEPAKDHS